MKQTKVFAFLALAFILGVAMPVAGITVANNVMAAEQAASDAATDQATEDAVNEDSAVSIINTTAKFVQALKDNTITSIKLTANINTMGLFRIDRTAPLTINLNGHNISSSSDHALQIEQGNITITGEGTLSGKAGVATLQILGSSDATSSNYTVVTIGSNVTVTGQNHYGIAIVDRNSNGKAYGVVVNLNGKLEASYGITVNGRITDTNNAPIININDGAVITTTSAESSLPFYSAGYANWNVGAATITSKAAVAMKAGKATFTGTSITVDGTTTNPTPSGNGINTNNSVFQIEHNVAYATDDIVININGGTYTSKQGDVFYEYNLPQNTRAVAMPADININGGTFTAAEGKAIFGSDVENPAVNIVITGGTFKGSDVASLAMYLASGLVMNDDGTVVVRQTSGSTTTPAPVEPETPATDEEEKPADKDDETSFVPDTGIVSGQGIINAISTTLPLLGLAGLVFIWFNRHMVKVRRTERMVEEERERAAKAYIPKMKREATVDHFVAEPMQSHNPDGPMVDMFVK